MNMISEPKNCPVCGGKAEIIYHFFKGTANRKHCFVRCSFCKYRPTKYGYSYRRENFEKAINNWNRSAEEFKAEVQKSTGKPVYVADKGLIVELNRGEINE